MHPFLSNGIREGGEEEGLLLYYVVLERAIERRGATSVDKTRSFRARNGDSGGEGEGEGPSIVPKLCEPVPLRLEARLESFSGWRLPDYDFD